MVCDHCPIFDFNVTGYTVGGVMIEDKIVDIIWGFLKFVAFCVVASLTFIFFSAITMGIMSIVYLLN